jgi:OFA family oxalate/formate antiporter-like MFS transporter
LSGLAVCGFGGGSIIASKVENKLIQSNGVAMTFVILGTVYAIIMYACVLVLRCPPPGYYVESPEERRLRREQVSLVDGCRSHGVTSANCRIHVQG